MNDVQLITSLAILAVLIWGFGYTGGRAVNDRKSYDRGHADGEKRGFLAGRQSERACHESLDRP